MRLLTALGRLTGALLLTLVASTLSVADAGAVGTWDDIVERGTVRIGVIPARPPYFWQEDGKWVGFSAEMGKDLAAAFSKEVGKDIEVEFVVTSWTTVILDIQADKIDAFFGLSYAEERDKAIHLAGPMYSLPSVILKAKGVDLDDTWEAFNNPDVNIAVVMGTTDEKVARDKLPEANIRALKGMGEAVLDIQSRNADAMVTTVLTGLGALKENASIGSMAVLQPVRTAPSYGGTRRDGDERFATFMQEWISAYRANGEAKRVILESMEKFGLDTNQLPPDVEF